MVIQAFKLTICLLLICVHTHTLSAQQNVVSGLDSIRLILDAYQTQDSFELYYQTLRSFEGSLSQIDFSQSITHTNALYDFLPSNKKDSLIYREHLMRHAVKIKNKLNDYHSANTFYLRAHDHALDKTYLDKWAWYIEKPMASNFSRLNNYENAVYYLKQCIPGLIKNNAYSKLSRLYSDLGDNYKWMDDEQLAFETFKQGLEYAETANAFRGIQALNANLADYYLNFSLDSDKEALFLKHYQNSKLALSSLTVKDQIDRKEELYGLKAQYHINKKEFGDALAYLNKALALSQSYSTGLKSREQAKNYVNLAHLFLAQGDLNQANDQYKKGLEKLTLNQSIQELPTEAQVINENTYTDLLAFKSQFYLEKFNLEKNALYLDSAIIAIDLAMLANLSLEHVIYQSESKYQSIATNKGLINKALSICETGLRETNDSKFIAKARFYFDRSKSKILNESRQKQARLSLMSKADSLQVDSINKQLIELYSNESIHNQIDQNMLSLVELKERKAKIFIKYPELSIELKPIETPYIEFVDADDKYYVFTNLGDNPFYQLDSKLFIEQSMDSLNRFIKDRDASTPTELLEKLYTLLIPNGLQENESISIIPDGQLAYLPFDILMNNNQYFIEQNPINIQFHHKQQVLNAKHKKNPIYFLVPAYEGDPLGDAIAERGDLIPLKYAKSEVDQINQLLNDDSMIDTEFELNSFSKKINSASIFHYSGHAIADNDNGYLAFGSERTFNIKQIEQLNTDLDLVTLSACETGLGNFRQGDGIRSLGSAFLNAGARSIVYSLWSANDQSTSKLMTDFYHFLNKGNDKDLALQKTKMNYLDQSSPEGRHPYYWAGFVSAGEQQSRHKSTNKIYFIAGFIIFFLFIFFKKIFQ